MYLNCFNVKASCWIDQNVVVSGNKINLIIAGKLVGNRMQYEIADVYIYSKFDNDVLRNKIKAVLQRTGALICVVDRGTNNSEGINLIANYLDQLGSAIFTMPDGTKFTKKQLTIHIARMEIELGTSKVKRFCVDLVTKMQTNSVFNPSSDSKKKFG